jgi:hypothetical protein
MLDKPQIIQKHCRHCNARINKETTQCWFCNKRQSYFAETVALFLIAMIITLTIWFNFFITTPVQLITGSKFENIDSAKTHSPKAAPASTPQIYTNTPRQSLTASQTQTRNPATPRLSNNRYQGTQLTQQTDRQYPFYVTQETWNPETRRYDFSRVGMEGTERVGHPDNRRYFLSENQSDYPKPGSGCGPTALLNLYIWYTKFGLLKESITHSNPTRYKQLKFRQIDRKIAEIQGHTRSPITGTNSLEQVFAIDELCQKYSPTPLRIHFEYKSPPLSAQDFININRNYRSGILSVRPKDPRTGRLMGNHAVLAIRGDTSGKIILANWGKFTNGRLVQKTDGQWFIPDDPSQHELLITRLTTLIPFTPRL